jgi:hypothetical protein
MISNVGNNDTSRLHQDPVNNAQAPGSMGQGASSLRAGEIPAATPGTPQAGPVALAPTSGVPSHQYGAALDAASVRYSAVIAGGGFGSLPAVYLTPEALANAVANESLIFSTTLDNQNEQESKDAVEEARQSKKEEAANDRKAADNIKDTGTEVFFENVGSAALAGAGAVGEFGATDKGGEIAKNSNWYKLDRLSTVGTKVTDTFAGKQTADGNAASKMAESVAATNAARADDAKLKQSQATDRKGRCDRAADLVVATMKDLQESHAAMLRAAFA